jgi:hypothetical protein
MLRPPDIAVGNYPIATEPLLGFEQQLYVCTQPATLLGMMTISAPNSGTYTANSADNLLLASAPQELLLIAETVGVIGDSPLVVQVIGTDQSGSALSGVATFTPPGYAMDTSYDVRQHRAAEVIPWQGGVTADGKKFKTVTSVSPISATASFQFSKWRLAGVPSITDANFKKIGTKMKLDLDEKVQTPVAIQDGADQGAYIKPGEIPIGNLSISTKDPQSSDGLRRYNGQPVTGLVKEVKRDRLATQHIFLLGLIMTAKPSGGEGQEAVKLDASAMYRAIGCVLAQ